MTTTIRLNGAKYRTDARNVAALVAGLQLPPQAVLIERNGCALTRGEWAETELLDGDALEILRVAAGG